MWFILSVIALLCWSGSDLFSKIGCKGQADKLSHLKMVTAVGVVMGIHAAYEIFINGVSINFDIILTYLPVSLLYIVSMAIGYLGLRYIELSISSPICNSSGAIVAILTLSLTGFKDVNMLAIAAVALVCIGVVSLGVVEITEDDELRELRQMNCNDKYSKSAIALILPIIYCVLDALGTFADSKVLEKIDEDSANAAYELTFLLIGIIAAIYVYGIKKSKPVFKEEWPKFTGACFETAGQFAYIYALADQKHVMFSAPIISSYCAASVLWSRIFLKEKLSYKHYISILITVAGIAILGLIDP